MVTAAELAMYRDPKTLNQAIKFSQTAAHNQNLLSKNRPKVRHVSFSGDVADNSPSGSKVQQIQVKQLGRDNVDIHIDWSELNDNMHKVVSYIEGRPHSTKSAVPIVHHRCVHLPKQLTRPREVFHQSIHLSTT